MLHLTHRRPARSYALVLALALLLAPLLALMPAPAQAAPSCVTADGTVTCTFSYTGAAETWTAPAGVTSATFDLYGAGGFYPGFSGKGGRVLATLEVAPGAAYQILVGGGNGFNGGGPGGKRADTRDGDPGGGASDVRLSPYALADRILVAGGGGGTPGSRGRGGSGGYPAGTSGGGGGGSQAAGGGGASGAGAGSLGQGGAGGDVVIVTDQYSGGGGGGGYYGGGGGSACEDLGSLCDVSGGGGGSSYATPAATSVSYETGVREGNGLVIVSYDVPDTTPPTSSAVTSPPSPNGADGWFTSDVTITFTATDNSGGSGVNRIYYSGGGGSGSATSSGSMSIGFSGDRTVTISYYAVDNAGNVEPLNTLTIKIDATPPTVSAAATSSPNANGWYNGDVTVQFSCADNLSGVASCPADQTLTGEGAAVGSTAQSATDVAGNTSNPSNIVTVAIDRTAPVVSVTGVTSGASYPLGGSPEAGCATSDALSGVATAAEPLISGGNPDGTGSFTATCSGATDQAGNAAPAVSVSYHVAYSFSGFSAPVDNPPTVNVANAGRSIPLKWRATDAAGNPITTLTGVSVTSAAGGCGASAPADTLEEYAGTTSGLQNLGNGFYQFNWKTEKSWGGSCRTLRLDLGDGSIHTALFRFR